MAGEYVLCVGANNYQDTTTGSAFVVFSPPRVYKKQKLVLCAWGKVLYGTDTKTRASSSSRSLQFPQNESDESDNDRVPHTRLFCCSCTEQKKPPPYLQSEA